MSAGVVRFQEKVVKAKSFSDSSASHWVVPAIPSSSQTMTDTSSRKRASRYIRLNPPPPIVLTARDKEVVRLVNDYRVIRQEHIEKLLFHSKYAKSRAQKRLWLLWQNRFLKREFKEEALRKGLIPYIPERPGPWKDDDRNEQIGKQSFP